MLFILILKAVNDIVCRKNLKAHLGFIDFRYGYHVLTNDLRLLQVEHIMSENEQLHGLLNEVTRWVRPMLNQVIRQEARLFLGHWFSRERMKTISK
jgi:hypothetical protein